MKSILLLALLMSVSAYAQVQPAYLKDATITVKLKSGKEYTYSANEYAVVKRQDPQIKAILADLERVEVEPSKPAPASETQIKRHKHIISGEVLSSRNGGLKDSSDPSQVKVETERKVGVGVMYQNNIYKDLYLGGRVDTNGGAGVNIGVGF